MLQKYALEAKYIQQYMRLYMDDSNAHLLPAMQSSMKFKSRNKNKLKEKCLTSALPWSPGTLKSKAPNFLQ